MISSAPRHLLPGNELYIHITYTYIYIYNNTNNHNNNGNTNSNTNTTNNNYICTYIYMHMYIYIYMHINNPSRNWMRVVCSVRYSVVFEGFHVKRKFPYRNLKQDTHRKVVLRPMFKLRIYNSGIWVKQLLNKGGGLS